jgi:uncharacterized protein YqgC (DUF456 family)
VTWEQIIGLSVALVIMLVGLFGNVIPALPGTPLVLAGAVAHRIYFGPAASASNAVMLALVLLTLLALLLDVLATMLGAKKFGATWRGALGAVVGGGVGLFFSLPGIILGPFLGAMLFEWLGRKELKPAAKAGVGAVAGLLLGVAGKCALSVTMIVLFTTNVIYRSVS